MGHFKDQSIPEYRDKDPQRYCSDCNKQISDLVHSNNKGLCERCKENK